MDKSPGEVPKIIPLEARNISAEAFKRLSKGDIPLADGMKIVGEGNKGDNRRRLRIAVKPNDPSLMKYRDDQDWMKEMTPRIRGLGHVDDGVMHETTTVSNNDMETLRLSVQKLQIDQYIKANEADFSRKYKNIPKGESEESIRQRQEFDSQHKEFHELTEYVKYLVFHDAVELILPGEKPDQAVATGKVGV